MAAGIGRHLIDGVATVRRLNRIVPPGVVVAQVFQREQAAPGSAEYNNGIRDVAFVKSRPAFGADPAKRGAQVVLAKDVARGQGLAVLCEARRG